ncbi:MAG TPA: hypothetical protein VLN42_03850, partial [Casimicrobiaceae bacterium]|nr:hypothetical protein [Casimicrobiaceae bacterium]
MARVEAGPTPAQQVVDARRIRELLQLEIEQFADLAPRGEIGDAARGERDRREARKEPDEERAPDRVHENRNGARDNADIGDIALDTVTHAVTQAGRPVDVSAREFALLAALLER